MAVLKAEEYDISYFDGKLSSHHHNAGYSYYQRFNVTREVNGVEYHDTFQIAHRELFDSYPIIHNSKLLDVGCAKGFLVEDFRSWGVEAYGIDVSEYAISCAIEDIKPYLVVGDARTYLTNYSDLEFDVLISQRFMECFEDEEIPNLVNHFNRISKTQIHVIDEWPVDTYYNQKKLNAWAEYDFKEGTILISRETNEVITK